MSAERLTHMVSLLESALDAHRALNFGEAKTLTGEAFVIATGLKAEALCTQEERAS